MPATDSDRVRTRMVRDEAVGLLALVAVAAFAAAFAHWFREAILRSVEWFGGSTDATVSLASLSSVRRFLLVFGGVLLASWIGRSVQRRVDGRLGIAAIANATRGKGEGPALHGTLARASATLATSATMGSIGREAAILEVGGTFGFHVGRGLRLDAEPGPERRNADADPHPRASALAVAGISAAFAAAYHAPFAATAYVEEHLGVRGRRRSAITAFLGALLGHTVAMRFLHGHPLFARVAPHDRIEVLKLGLIALLPAAASARLFLAARQRWGQAAVATPSTSGHDRWRSRRRNAGFAVVAALAVTLAPQAAGNGMEGIRHTAGGASAALLVALAVAKMVATTAEFGSGAPGGVVSPAMAVSVGWVLVAFAALDRVGFAVPADRWPAVLAAMVVGLAVGLEMPLVAGLMVAEMTGDLALIPYTAALALAAFLLERGAERAWHRFRTGSWSMRHVPVPVTAQDG